MSEIEIVVKNAKIVKETAKIVKENIPFYSIPDR